MVRKIFPKIFPKIFVCILMLFLAVSFTAFSFTEFDGSRTGNESRLILKYKMLNTTDSRTLKLSAGDVVHFEVVSRSGSVDITLQKGAQEPVYEGVCVPTSSFDVEVKDGGDYLVSVTGKRAKGSVSVTKAGDSGFASLSVSDYDVISSEFEIDLQGKEATFLAVEVTEDMEAAVHYTYTTREK